MKEANATPSSRRATLILGYGSFGREVLERLLASAVPRGELAWEEPQLGADANERSLRDLALVHVPDRMAGVAGEQAAAGLLGDIYRQIVALDEDASEARLTQIVSEVAERMLSATARAGRPEALPLGLDVIVLARPEAPEALGLLDRLLVPAFETLANNANLMRSARGAEALCFVEILDFDNYWDRSSAGLAVRRATVSSVEQWQRRRSTGLGAFGRVYLVDGRTADGIRDRRHRVDETSLFLELLLFEGQRGGELQSLWQASSLGEPPLGTFAVRSLERSGGLLRRLAAARFAVDWLEHLAAGDAASGGERLSQRLAPFRLSALEALLNGDALRVRLAGQLESLEQALLRAWREAPEQPDRVVAHYRQAAQEITTDLSGEVAQRFDLLRRERLEPLRSTLQEAVVETLHHEREPARLGAVIERLETIEEELDPHSEKTEARSLEELPEDEPTGGVIPADATSESFNQLAARYLAFRRRRASTQDLRQVWPLLAVSVAAGLTPILSQLLSDLPAPSGSLAWLGWAHGALVACARPVLLGPLLFVLGWILGRGVFQGIIDRKQDRAERFFVDAERGRLIDLLRRELASQGVLGKPLHAELEGSLDDMLLAAREHLHRELRRVINRLEVRRREMLWLRGEMLDFLAQHGVDLAQGWHRLDREQRDATGIRCSVERAADFERVLASNPPTAERFRSVQADQRPFRQLFETYSDAFLYPLEFVDRLSALYHPARQAEAPGEGISPAEASGLDQAEQDLLDFLHDRGAHGLAFAWQAQEGVPAARRLCLLPEAWRRLPSALRRLSEQGIGGERVLHAAGGATAYLLSLQSGVSSQCLVEGTVAAHAISARAERAYRGGLPS